MDEKPKIPWWQPGMVLFTRLSGWIGVPVIIGVFVGKWLDRKYNSEPWLFLATVGVAFVFSMIGIVRETMQEIKRIEKEAKKNRDLKNSEDKNDRK
jgi:F0F1-type ATP synthase assembly protein I